MGTPTNEHAGQKLTSTNWTKTNEYPSAITNTSKANADYRYANKKRIFENAAFLKICRYCQNIGQMRTFQM